MKKIHHFRDIIIPYRRNKYFQSLSVESYHTTRLNCRANSRNSLGSMSNFHESARLFRFQHMDIREHLFRFVSLEFR